VVWAETVTLTWGLWALLGGGWGLAALSTLYAQLSWRDSPDRKHNSARLAERAVILGIVGLVVGGIAVFDLLFDLLGLMSRSRPEP
jgi:hypothetical protein